MGENITKSDRKVVVYMGDNRISGMMRTALKSLLCNTKVDRVYFLLDGPGFPGYLPEVVKCVDVSRQKYFRFPNPNYHPFYGYMTWMRAALSKVLPDEDRVLLLDPDTLVVDDISPIWETDLTGYYFAAVPETRNNDHEKVPYFNAGVMLMNLVKLREDGMDDRVINEINTVRYKHLEQDVLNFLCDGKILKLPSEYNASFVSDPTDHPKIMHFLSYAKKDFASFGREYERLDWMQVAEWGKWNDRTGTDRSVCQQEP